MKPPLGLRVRVQELFELNYRGFRQNRKKTNKSLEEEPIRTNVAELLQNAATMRRSVLEVVLNQGFHGMWAIVKVIGFF